MSNRENIYNSIQVKMESAGFQFETAQNPYLQNRKENELKFVHPGLVKRFEEDGYTVGARKFYIKPLTDEAGCEIGFVTGKTSPLYKKSFFAKPNSTDSFDETPAWANKESDSALDSLLESIKKYLNTRSVFSASNMSTYLFTWNPTRWNWGDLKESIEHLETVGYLEKRWSCGNSKNIKKGDRVFLIRLGKEPKGIMGSGYAKSSYYFAPHWDGTEGKVANYIDIEFDILINPEINPPFNKESLDSIDLKKSQQWFPQQSGISINPELTDSLEAHWFNFIKENKYIKNSFVSNDGITEINESFQEGKSKDIIQTRYERNREARKRCLAQYGYSCSVCDFNFEDHFGDLGKGFIHVHHIIQISEIGREYKVDPIKDLRPVCPNCHAMLHKKNPAYLIDELKEMMK